MKNCQSIEIGVLGTLYRRVKIPSCDLFEGYLEKKASIQNESSNGRSTLHEVPYFLCICDILLKGLRTRTVPLTFFTFYQKNRVPDEIL